MNILFINQFQANKNQGGVQIVTKILSDYLKNYGYTIYFIFFDQYEKGKIENENEYKFINSKINRIENRKLLTELIFSNNINIIINQYGFNKDVIKLVNATNYQGSLLSILHSSPDFELKDINIQLSKGFSFEYSARLNLKILVKPIYYHFIKRKLTKRLEFIYDNSDSTILLSNKFKPLFQNLSKIKDLTKLKAISNPVDPQLLNVAKIGIVKEKSALYVGRLNKGKRVDLLIQIWKEIDFFFPHWKLDIVGDGPELEYLKLLTKSLKLKSIIFHGSSLNVKDYYQKASIFVTTSAFEGFPLVLAEAQAFGVVPVVYNTFESVTDVITNEKTGFIVSDLDKKTFVNHIIKLMEDKNMRYTMSKKCIENVKKFDIEIIGKEWINIINEII